MLHWDRGQRCSVSDFSYSEVWKAMVFMLWISDIKTFFGGNSYLKLAQG